MWRINDGILLLLLCKTQKCCIIDKYLISTATKFFASVSLLKHFCRRFRCSRLSGDVVWERDVWRHVGDGVDDGDVRKSEHDLHNCDGRKTHWMQLFLQTKTRFLLILFPFLLGTIWNSKGKGCNYWIHNYNFRPKTDGRCWLEKF